MDNIQKEKQKKIAKKNCTICNQGITGYSTYVGNGTICKKCYESVEKPCSDCNKIYPIKNFPHYKDKCKICDKRMRDKNRRPELISRKLEMKISAITYKGSKCEDCGIAFPVYPPNVFDFHHINPDEKEHGLNQLLRRRRSITGDVKEELDKCVLLCSNCHRMRHKKDSELYDMYLKKLNEIPAIKFRYSVKFSLRMQHSDDVGSIVCTVNHRSTRFVFALNINRIPKDAWDFNEDRLFRDKPEHTHVNNIIDSYEILINSYFSSKKLLNSPASIDELRDFLFNRNLYLNKPNKKLGNKK